MSSIIILVLFSLCYLSIATPYKSNLTSVYLSFLKAEAKPGQSFPITSSNRQYTGDFCETDSECTSPRGCYNVNDQRCTSSDSLCICASLNDVVCDTSSDCLPYDRCYSGSGGVCISCNYDTSDVNSSPIDAGNCDGSVIDEGGVCISVDALSHLDQSMLVFSTDRRASVLCDKFENCATSAHIVVHNGKAMTMSDYCGQHSVFCVRRVRLVNSPRMKIGLRLGSNSDHLKYTAFAASKETFAEKFVLKSLVRMGM